MSNASPYNPLYQPNEVGARIRRYRERAALSTRALARKVGVAESYVSKVELGQLSPQSDFCDKVAKALHLPRSERELLLALLTFYRSEHHPVSSDSNDLRQAQQAIRQLERGCNDYKVFQFSLIPGLLQTPGYMRAIFARVKAIDRMQASVGARRARQAILEDSGRSFQFLIADWALFPHWCSDKVMVAQRSHLLKAAERMNVEIRVLPPDVRFSGLVPPLACGFEVIDDAIVIVDTLSGFTTFRHPEAVATYVGAFEQTLTTGVPIRRWARS
jgi:transcriptional regulator with XRE-family HTH domain